MSHLTEKDLHVHTVYCPHRHSDAPMEAYLTAAEKQGLKEVSFTEHAPFAAPLSLTQYAVDPMMQETNLKQYFDGLWKLRETYQGPIAFKIGLEIDYLEGYEEAIAKSLGAYGPFLEDSLISVHNLRIGDRFYNVCDTKAIAETVEMAGGEERLIERYYQTLIKYMTLDLGPYMPKRIAHPTVYKFARLLYPKLDALPDIVEEFAKTVKEKGCVLEINTSGIRYPTCREHYGVSLLPYILKYEIPVALGSDSHEPKDVGTGFQDPWITGFLDQLHVV